jgi:hypothetical protein
MDDYQLCYIYVSAVVTGDVTLPVKCSRNTPTLTLCTYPKPPAHIPMHENTPYYASLPFAYPDW